MATEIKSCIIASRIGEGLHRAGSVAWQHAHFERRAAVPPGRVDRPQSDQTCPLRDCRQQPPPEEHLSATQIGELAVLRIALVIVLSPWWINQLEEAAPLGPTA